MLNLKHGGHILDDRDPGDPETRKRMEESAKKIDGDVLASRALPKDEPEITETPFGYLFSEIKDDPASHLPANNPGKVNDDLKALAREMVEARAVDDPPSKEGNSVIPPIYTYWGQFIDHDLTANTDRPSMTSDITTSPVTPIAPGIVMKELHNLRKPALDLDSVYGNGPSFLEPKSKDAGFYDGARFRIGQNAEVGGAKIPPDEDLNRDLPRIGTLLDAGVIKEGVLPEDLRDDPNLRTRPFIGDLRNDENLVIAQLHVAFLRFHNKVVDWIKKHEANQAHDKVKVFKRARQLTRWHYQWLVVHDYLKTVPLGGIVEEILLNGPKHYEPLPGGKLFMPLEYSVAAFRFGHSMVRGSYDYNRNFGEEDLSGVPDQPPFATFDQLFLFTGNGFQRDKQDPKKITRNPFLGLPTLPSNWIIEWNRFTDKNSADRTHFARKIDTRLAFPLKQMVNEGNTADVQGSSPAKKVIRDLLRFLAQRNLLRGYQLSIPTGQSVAAAMGVPVLTEQELRKDNSPELNAVLEHGGFLKKTPLWYYVLKEAEVRANGNSLGELGSRIVCETIIGLLRNSPNSILKEGWDPSKGVKLDNGDPIVTIRDFLKFADLPA